MKAIQPGRIGTQNVANRNRNSGRGMPPSLDADGDEPADQPAASAAPRPPGVGAAVAMAQPIRYTAPMVTKRSSIRKALQP